MKISFKSLFLLLAAIVAGKCPRIKPGDFGICAFTCGSGCRDGKICCPTACGGTVCKTPVRRKCFTNKKIFIS